MGALLSAILFLFHSAPAATRILRFYISVLSCFVLCAELEWTIFTSQFRYMESWIGRGLHMIFAGILLLADNDKARNDTVEDESSVLLDAVKVSGIALEVLGVVYFGLGLTCFRKLRERQLLSIRKKIEARKARSDLVARKHEIERLLADTEDKLEKL